MINFQIDHDKIPLKFNFSISTIAMTIKTRNMIEITVLYKVVILF